MPVAGARVTGGTMTMLDGELFADLAVFFGGVRFATQLFVPELILEPSAMFERVVGLASAEGVTLGAVTRGVESPLVRTGDVETEGTRMSPVLA